ncbi:MAG: dihydrolipoamide acetyltransferase family protein [Actinomycetota bacterium]
MAERVFSMPDLGEGLEEGTVVVWLVAEGDTVGLNEPLVEVETAKATVEIPSPFTGTVVRLHGATGEDVPVGAPLVTFEVAGASGGEQVRATPPVRKLAKELDVELAGVAGTGPGGRITEEDVRAAPGADDDAVAMENRLDTDSIPVSPVRRAIARNLERQAAIPQVTTFRTVECAALDAVRRELGVSPLPVFVAALCGIVPDHPLANARWTPEAIHTWSQVNVGIAVDTERGLVVPVVRAAEGRDIPDLAAEIGRLAQAARGNALRPDDVVGATIAVSNTGSYGSEAGTPILSPGTSVTIALGVIAPRAVVVDGEVVARPTATLSFTFDHRVLDGAAAGRALTDLVDILQSEERLRDLPR